MKILSWNLSWISSDNFFNCFHSLRCLMKFTPFFCFYTRSFDVFWNIPSFMCSKHEIDFTNLNAYGIQQNFNDEYRWVNRNSIGLNVCNWIIQSVYLWAWESSISSQLLSFFWIRNYMAIFVAYGIIHIIKITILFHRKIIIVSVSCTMFHVSWDIIIC